MRHDFIDRYSYLDSPIHRLPATLKLVFTLAAILGLLAVEDWFPGYGLALAFLLFLILLSRVPILFILGRSLIVVPFLGLVLVFMAFFQTAGPQKIIYISLRAWLSVTVLIWLISTTPFPELLRAMNRLKAPALIQTLLGFIYRYFFLLSDEAHRMQRSIRMRSSGPRLRLGLKVYSQLLVMLFLRSYERSERVYQAMMMRGFRPQRPEGAYQGQDHE